MLQNSPTGHAQEDECWPTFQLVAMQTLNILEAVQTFCGAWKSFIAHTNVNCFQRDRIHMKAKVMYMLSSKIENTH
jgi:hypothetical protein